jgi:hypothetical protein
MTEPYNGWTNHETWLVALWIDNDEGLYAQKQEMLVKEEMTRENLKDWVEESVDLALAGVDNGIPPASLTLDLVNSALNRVDWDEIAEKFVADEEDRS